MHALLIISIACTWVLCEFMMCKEMQTWKLMMITSWHHRYLFDQQFHSCLHSLQTVVAFDFVHLPQQDDSVGQSRGVEDSETFLDQSPFGQNSEQIYHQQWTQRCGDFHSQTQKCFHHHQLQHQLDNTSRLGWCLAVQSEQVAVQLTCISKGSDCLCQQWQRVLV